MSPHFSDADVTNAFPELTVQVPMLGEGSFKAAYHVVSSPEDLVLKILLEPVDLDAEEFDAASVSERFTRELFGMEAIDSPHVVRVVAAPALRVIGSQNHVYYLEPLYPGGTLRDRISQGALSSNELRSLGLDLLFGVKALWEPHGIVHRDIKPSNIVFDASGRAVLLDLGIALYTTLNDITDSGVSSPRTNPYSAPEQFDVRRNATIDFRTDLFLIGIALYEAATGRHPFITSNPMTAGAYLDNLENFDPSVLDGVAIDDEIKGVIARCLAGKMARRFRTIDEPIRALGGN